MTATVETKAIIPPTLDSLLKDVQELRTLVGLRTFRGFYRQGSFGPLEKVFKCAGTLNDAKDKFYKHCKNMGYIFVIVRPYEVDLDEQEIAKAGNPDYVDEAFGRTRI